MAVPAPTVIPVRFWDMPFIQFLPDKFSPFSVRVQDPVKDTRCWRNFLFMVYDFRNHTCLSMGSLRGLLAKRLLDIDERYKVRFLVGAFLMQVRVVVTHQPHKLKYVGSNPTPAICEMRNTWQGVFSQPCGDALPLRNVDNLRERRFCGEL